MERSKPLLPLLEAGPVPLTQIRAHAKKQLVDLIDSKRGKKALILDPAISGSLTQLDAGLSELFTEHGIVKLLYLERLRLDDAAYNSGDPRLSDIRPLIYIARATLDNAQLIAWQIKNSGTGSNRATARHEFSVFWVPRRSIAVERVLEDEGVYGDVTQGEFPLDLVPLDDDVLSLELESAFRECTLEGDPSSLFYTASAVMKLQHMFGLIPRLQGKGPAAAAVKDMLLKMRRESPLLQPSPGDSSSGSSISLSSSARIHRAILIDREIDPVTPMVTQTTFEGLIDEVTGIRNGSVPHTASRREGGGPATEGGRTKPGSTLLNSAVPFYKEFRDLPYDVASQRLYQYAREGKREYSDLSNKDFSGVKTFVKGMGNLLLLERLSDVAMPVADVIREQPFHDRLKTEQEILDGADVEAAITFITELMWQGSDAVIVLRLLCLVSAACGGLPRKHSDALRTEFLAAYGHQHLLTLNNLERSGLLKPQVPGSRSNFSALRKALRLIVADDQQGGPVSDVSHLYKGYAPISIRLVEAALLGGWGPMAEALAMLPGAQFDCLQVVEPSGQVVDRPLRVAAGAAGAAAAAAAAAAAGGEPETVLLVMLGGITFSEISALRFLSSLPEVNCRFLVLTTKIINGRTLLETFIDPPARSIRKA